MKIEIYHLEELMGTVVLEQNKLTVTSANKESSDRFQEFVESLRYPGMSDKELFESLTRRLKSYIYAVKVSTTPPTRE